MNVIVNVLEQMGSIGATREQLNGKLPTITTKIYTYLTTC
jgi:hypothetical protein